MQSRQLRPRLGKGVITPVIILTLTTSYLLQSLKIGPAFSPNGVPEASFMPILLAGATFLALVPIILRELFGQENATDLSGAPSLINPALFILTSALFVLAFATLGYFIATLLYGYAIITIFRFRDGATLRGQIYRIIASAGIAFVVFLFFRVLFKVRLPEFMDGF